MPAKSSGNASGSSTRAQRSATAVIPIPRAASTASGSTSSTATYAFVRIGGTARITSATSTFVKPKPKTLSPIAITARLGSARPMFARVDREERAAVQVAEPDAERDREHERDRHRRRREQQMLPRLLEQELASLDDEREGVAEGAEARAITPSSAPGAHGVSARWVSTSSASATSASRIASSAGGDDLRLEVVAQRDEDRPPETLRDHERGDRRERDRGDGRDAQAGDDRRQRQRQLDPPERLPPRQPHPARRLEHLGRRRAEPFEHVAEEDQERVADERDLDREHGEAGDRHEQLEERDARDRVEEGREEPRTGPSTSR